MSAYRGAVFTTAVVLLSNWSAHAQSVAIQGSDTLAATNTSYTTTQLVGLANSNNTVSWGGYTGVSLWSVLGGSDTTTTSGSTKFYGDIVTLPQVNGNRNYDLRYYVVASGSSTTSVSLGQIDPAFVGVGQAAPFVAYQTAGGSLLSTPMLVVPNGPLGSSVLNLSSLTISAAPATTGSGSAPQPTVTVTGDVTDPATYSSFSGGSTLSLSPTGPNYLGIPLATFLNVPSDVDGNSEIVVARGSDGYTVVYSLDELITGGANDILAYSSTAGDFPKSGIARTILAGDFAFAHGRWESNLESLDVESVPGPIVGAGLPGLLLAGAGLLGWWRRRRLVEAVA